MSNWLTEQEVVEGFVVGERNLLRFSRDGMLPRRTSEQGQTLYAEEFVSAMFRRRGHVSLTVVGDRGAAHELGFAYLGEASRVHAPQNVEERFFAA